MAARRHGRRCKISSQPAAGDPQHVAIPLTWGDPQGLPVLAANQLAVQFDSFDGRPDLVILTFGHVAAPILVGSDDQRKRAVEQIDKVEVQPLARVSLSVNRLREWAELLQTTVHKLEQAQRGEE